MFADRLKLARKKAGYSLRGLSDALDNKVSAQAIGKYERDQMMPASDVLTAMAKVLDVNLEYLLSNQVKELSGVEFRKKSGTSVKDRSRVEATVIERVERYLSVEEILELDSAEWHQPFDPVRLETLEAAEQLAERLREEWDLGIDPIPNMTELLEEKGIKVLVIELPEKVSGLTCLVDRGEGKALVPVIVVNKDFPLERRRFTLAHELGHRLIDESSPIDHEKASDIFAGSFLVNSEHLRGEIGSQRHSVSFPELIDLKRLYRVSAASMLMRFKQAGILSESAVAYAFQTFARSWRREEPRPLEAENQKGTFERPKRFERLCYWALSEKLISPAKASEFLQIPYFKMEQVLQGNVEEYENNN
ncbi:XRE family transcriptional regulator [Haliea sp. E1-2-M8]|uniref:helix-turn-helix domain-containing protein n=1 Tax=Haliea sp. E1-2-M8 TaxID=3064706 RepID=UPI0027189888|nr:XRE family transcriptional regulator [Haliea sp. E1-2-M8]MDO8863241.1 XRE family transcriptional regulator [Haliea sp. E1-2-M8]